MSGAPTRFAAPYAKTASSTYSVASASEPPASTSMLHSVKQLLEIPPPTLTAPTAARKGAMLRA